MNTLYQKSSGLDFQTSVSHNDDNRLVFFLILSFNKNPGTTKSNYPHFKWFLINLIIFF